MAKQTSAQKETVARVMHEFKRGELDGRDGEPIKSPKQAIAIALNEAGASDQEDARTNRKTLARTKAKERRRETARDAAEGGRTKDVLYAEAKRRGIPGRASMNKAQLERALQS